MLCEHDYYAICLLILPLLILLKGVTLALQHWSAKTITRLLLACWLVGLVHCSYVLQKRMHLAIAPPNTLTLPAAAFLTPQQLEATGLPTFARLLCPEDPSPNIYLSALQRPGWTNYNFQHQYTADTLSHYCQRFGLTHLALRDTSAYTPLFQEVFPTKTAQLAGWHIYSRQ
jgi:hypothetical protein